VNLHSAFDIDDVSELTGRLVETARDLRKIILFGSRARGDARRDSDVDVLVVEGELEDEAQEWLRLAQAVRTYR
jgi:predicted nucleotidyltransferase